MQNAYVFKIKTHRSQSYVSDFPATRKTIDGLKEHTYPVGNLLLRGIKWGQTSFFFDREHLNISCLQKYQQASVDVQFQKE
jgi:hypothetical protein